MLQQVDLGKNLAYVQFFHTRVHLLEANDAVFVQNEHGAVRRAALLVINTE